MLPKSPRELTKPFALLALGAAFLTSCATEPGQPWGALALSTKVQLHVPADRLVPGGWVRTAAGYAMRLDRVEIDVREVAVRVQTSTASSGIFDPANPPARYSLCHNGHCHRDDGALIDYADIEAELLAAAGQTAAPAGVVLALADQATATTQGSEVPLPQCSATERCALPRGDLATATVRVASLHVVGVVRDLDADRLQGRELPLDLLVDLGADASPMGVSAQLSGSLDNGEPAGVDLDLRLVVQPLWLDGTDVGAVVGQQAELTTAALDESMPQLRERFRSAAELRADVRRVHPK